VFDDLIHTIRRVVKAFFLPLYVCVPLLQTGAKLNYNVFPFRLSRIFLRLSSPAVVPDQPFLFPLVNFLLFRSRNADFHLQLFFFLPLSQSCKKRTVFPTSPFSVQRLPGLARLFFFSPEALLPFPSPLFYVWRLYTKNKETIHFSLPRLDLFFFPSSVIPPSYHSLMKTDFVSDFPFMAGNMCFFRWMTIDPHSSLPQSSPLP